MKRLRAADLFCGAGGFTTGAVQSGCVDVVLAVNHWRTAIYTHQENHPETRHICAKIDDIDPRHDRTLPELDMLLASPECTHHSIARGGRPICDQKRATPWHVIIWAETKRPKWVIVENVREFRDWGPIDNNGRPIKSQKGKIFRQWVKSLESLGYQVDHQVLNAADFGAATSRQRLFIVARRGRRKADIPWPEITHPKSSWRPAHEIIDWTKPCPSIFARKRPLADKTLKRIEIGLRKFVGGGAEPFLVKLRGSRAGVGTGGTVHGTASPLGTITAGGTHHGLAVPFQMKAMGRCPGLTRGITETVPTIVAARENHAIVVPFITQYHNGPDGPNRNYSVDAPLLTLDTQNRYGVVAPYLLAINHGGVDDRSRSPREPIATLTTKNGHSLVLPFLTKYYGTAGAQPVGEPLDTITTRDRFGLACASMQWNRSFPSVRYLLNSNGTEAAQSLIATMFELGVIDIGFRMLDVDELAAAQGFPKDYALFGTKADRVRQIGNSVSPPVARALCQCYAEAG